MTDQELATKVHVAFAEVTKAVSDAGKAGLIVTWDERTIKTLGGEIPIFTATVSRPIS